MKMTMEERMQKMMDVVEHEMPETGRVKVHLLLNDNHNDEYSANTQLAHMVPVAYIGTERKPGNMHEYMSMLGLTPEVAMDIVNDAGERAKSIASKHGIDAPHMEANMWDAYWCIGMMLSDYWATIQGDLDVAALLAYQYLSDPDR